ncbi:MAG: hypothetical protein RL211_242 [Pseudomonadota bacterium]|jgi:hypothetical protein
MTLGRVRGSALIGQPLDLSFPVQFDAEDNITALCVDADIFHADTRQDVARVKVSVSVAQPLRTAIVRVESSQPVDEPMVTVYLKAGCGQKVTRRYVLLADFPSEPASAPIALAAPQVSAAMAAEAKIGSTWAEVPSPAQPIAKVQQNVGIKPSPGARKLKMPAAPAKTILPPAEKSVASERQLAKSLTPQPRLQLESLEVLAERGAVLEAAKGASAPVPVPADDIVKDVMRFQSLEGDMKTLLSLAAKNEASLLEMKARLERAESERFANWLVYALSAAILLCLASIWTLWNRQRTLEATKSNWWREDEASTEKVNLAGAEMTSALGSAAVDAVPDVLDRNVQVARAVKPPEPQDHDPISSVDLHLSEISASTFDTLLQSGPAPIRSGKPSVLDGLSSPGDRCVSPDDSVDIRQQAEFFVSLGQTDQAVRVLESHIAENIGSSPGLYLDLLHLFHSLNLKTDFRQYREDFNLLFNSRIPEFALFKQEGQNLESYPDALAEISAAWYSQKVLQVLETLIFHNSRNNKVQVFDLAAFRELLLLYGIALSDQRGGGAHSESQSDFASKSFVREGVRSEFGKVNADTFVHTRQSDIKASQLASGSSDLVHLESLPSIYPDIDVNLDLNSDESSGGENRK